MGREISLREWAEQNGSPIVSEWHPCINLCTNPDLVRIGST